LIRVGELLIKFSMRREGGGKKKKERKKKTAQRDVPRPRGRE